MNATFARKWIIRTVSDHVVRHSDASVEHCGPVYSAIETILATNRQEAERIAAEKHPGKKIDVCRAS